MVIRDLETLKNFFRTPESVLKEILLKQFERDIKGSFEELERFEKGKYDKKIEAERLRFRMPELKQQKRFLEKELAQKKASIEEKILEEFGTYEDAEIRAREAFQRTVGGQVSHNKQVNKYSVDKDGFMGKTFFTQKEKYARKAEKYGGEARYVQIQLMRYQKAKKEKWDYYQSEIKTLENQIYDIERNLYWANDTITKTQKSIDTYEVSYKGQSLKSKDEIHYLSSFNGKLKACMEFQERILKQIEQDEKIIKDFLKNIPPHFFNPTAETDNRDIHIGFSSLEKEILSPSQWLIFFYTLNSKLKYPQRFFSLPQITLQEYFFTHFPTYEIKADKPYLKFQEVFLSQDAPKAFFLRTFKTLIPFPARLRHTYILGKTGVGKSELMKLMLYNDIKRKSGVLLIEPHGQFARECSTLAIWKEKAYQDNLIYVSTDFVREGLYPSFNPLQNNYSKLSTPEKRHAISQRTEELANAFKILFESDFTDNMSRMLTNCLRLLLERETSNLMDLLLLLQSGKEAEFFFMMAKNHWDGIIRNYFAYDFQKRIYDRTKSAIVTRFERAFSNLTLRYMLTNRKSTFNVEKALTQGKTILINAGKGSVGADGSKILGTFLMAEVASFAMRRDRLSKTQKQYMKHVFIYIDECQNFVNEKIDEILAEARKYKIHLVLANQFLGQLGGSAPLVRLRKSIMANTAVKICGRLSSSDRNDMGKEMNTDLERADTLGIGEFIMKTGMVHALKFKAHDFLIQNREGTNGNYLTDKEYKWVMQNQKKKYYRNVIEAEESKPPLKGFNEKRQKKGIDTPPKTEKKDTPKKSKFNFPDLK